MTDKSVEETLAAAAQATSAPAQAAPKKERVKREQPGSTTAGIDGDQTPKVRKTRVPRTDADGNPIVKAPKEPKAPREPKEKLGRIGLVLGNENVTLAKIQNEAQITVHGNLGSKEGSKRAERAKAFENASTVQEFFANGGVNKDLLRHLKSGAVSLTVNGEQVKVKKVEEGTQEIATGAASPSTGQTARSVEGEPGTEGQAEDLPTQLDQPSSDELPDNKGTVED